MTDTGKPSTAAVTEIALFLIHLSLLLMLLSFFVFPALHSSITNLLFLAKPNKFRIEVPFLQ